MKFKSATLVVTKDKKKGDWYTWHVVEDDNNEMWFGGYSSFAEAILGLISEQEFHGHFDRLQNEDAERIASMLSIDIEKCIDLSEYIFDKFYEHKRYKK